MACLKEHLVLGVSQAWSIVRTVHFAALQAHTAAGPAIHLCPHRAPDLSCSAGQSEQQYGAGSCCHSCCSQAPGATRALPGRHTWRGPRGCHSLCRCGAGKAQPAAVASQRRLRLLCMAARVCCRVNAPVSPAHPPMVHAGPPRDWRCSCMAAGCIHAGCSCHRGQT